jgi:hypothetical protein
MNNPTEHPAAEGGGGRGSTWLERIEPTVVLLGPLTVGAATAGYGVATKALTITAALAAGWALWQLSMIVVVLWSIATTVSDPSR